ncbi:MAG: hypothetical protein IH898_07315 [Planctomycetes bacterium]|jgi:hypothetical protein|nr:hypothetical protein [Planctomycetota bacterium]
MDTTQKCREHPNFTVQQDQETQEIRDGLFTIFSTDIAVNKAYNLGVGRFSADGGNALCVQGHPAWGSN